jgi:hypothetical protein
MEAVIGDFVDLPFRSVQEPASLWDRSSEIYFRRRGPRVRFRTRLICRDLGNPSALSRPHSALYVKGKARQPEGLD